jgi:hypothetical protein
MARRGTEHYFAWVSTTPHRKPRLPRVTLTCEHCSTPYSRKPSDVERDGTSFCSTHCRTEASRLGVHGPHSYFWDRTRAAILQRDGGTCQLCATSERLDVHHIVPASHYGDTEAEWEEANRPANLITLCHCCHGRSESKPRLLLLTQHGRAHLDVVRLAACLADMRRKKRGSRYLAHGLFARFRLRKSGR